MYKVLKLAKCIQSSTVRAEALSIVAVGQVKLDRDSAFATFDDAIAAATTLVDSDGYRHSQERSKSVAAVASRMA